MAFKYPSGFFARFLVSEPTLGPTGFSRRAFVRLLHRRIDFSPRVPCLPFVEIIYLGKYRRRRGRHGGAPCDAEIRWLQSHDDDKHDNDDGEGDEDFNKHRDSSTMT